MHCRWRPGNSFTTNYITSSAAVQRLSLCGTTVTPGWRRGGVAWLKSPGSSVAPSVWSHVLQLGSVYFNAEKLFSDCGTFRVWSSQLILQAELRLQLELGQTGGPEDSPGHRLWIYPEVCSQLAWPWFPHRIDAFLIAVTMYWTAALWGRRV